MSGDNFSRYEQDIRALFSGIRSSIAMARTSHGEQRKSCVRQCENDIDQGRDIIAQMELDLRSQSGSYQANRTSKLRNIKTEIEQLGRELYQLKMNGGGANNSSAYRTGGYNSSYGAIGENEDPQRQRLLNAHSQLDRTSERLKNAERIALETENIGVGILGELGEQRDMLENTAIHLEDTNQNLTRADRRTSSMMCQKHIKSIIGFFIAIAVIAIIVGIIYVSVKN